MPRRPSFSANSCDRRLAAKISCGLSVVASITRRRPGTWEPVTTLTETDSGLSERFGGAHTARISSHCHKVYTLRVLMIEASLPLQVDESTQEFLVFHIRQKIPAEESLPMSGLTAAAISNSSRSSEIYDLMSRTNGAIITIAHRALWSAAPENSLAAIRAAAELGVEFVEIDTQATADGHLVVIHDRTLDRTTSGNGIVGASSFQAVRSTHLRVAAGGDAAALTDERVPTLEEALEEARGRVFVNIDTKFPHELPLVIATVRRLGAEDCVIIKSDVLPESRDFPVVSADWFGSIPHMPMFPVRPGKFAADLKLIEALRAPMVEVKFTDVAELAAGREELERQNIRLWINTLDVSHNLDFNDSRALKDPEGVWGALIEAGVGAIQTDTNVEFKRWLSSRKPV